MPDDDDRPRDASGAAGSAGGDDLTVAWSTAVAPDDISELAGDIKAYHRERRAAHRRELFHRVYDHRGAAPITMAISALALVAIVLTLLSLTAPGSTRTAGSLPRAHPGVPVGQVGGLLPDAQLVSVSLTPVSLRSLPTPGVVAVMPEQCDCQPLLNQVADIGSESGLKLSAVAPRSDAEADSLGGRIDNGTRVYHDENGALSSELAASGVTLILVNRDGTIYQIQSSVGSTTDTDTELAAAFHAMLAPKASAA